MENIKNFKSVHISNTTSKVEFKTQSKNKNVRLGNSYRSLHVSLGKIVVPIETNHRTLRPAGNCCLAIHDQVNVPNAYFECVVVLQSL